MMPTIHYRNDIAMVSEGLSRLGKFRLKKYGMCRQGRLPSPKGGLCVMELCQHVDSYRGIPGTSLLQTQRPLANATIPSQFRTLTWAQTAFPLLHAAVWIYSACCTCQLP